MLLALEALKASRRLPSVANEGPVESAMTIRSDPEDVRPFVQATEVRRFSED